MPVGRLYVFGEMSISFFCPFFDWVVYFFEFESYEQFVYFGRIVYKYFLPLRMLCLHFVDGFLCCAKAFKFDYAPFVYFCCYFFCLGRLI